MSGPLQGLKIRGACSTGWRECVLPVEIGLTDLPKTGGAQAPSAPLLRQPCMCSSFWQLRFESHDFPQDENKRTAFKFTR